MAKGPNKKLPTVPVMVLSGSCSLHQSFEPVTVGGTKEQQRV